MRQFDVFVNYLAFAGVTLGMHFFDDLIVRKIIYVYKTMPEMGTNAGKQCGKNIRMIGDNNFWYGCIMRFFSKRDQPVEVSDITVYRVR